MELLHELQRASENCKDLLYFLRKRTPQLRTSVKVETCALAKLRLEEGVEELHGIVKEQVDRLVFMDAFTTPMVTSTVFIQFFESLLH